MKKIILGILVLSFFIVAVYFFMNNSKPQEVVKTGSNSGQEIRYIPIGDSYTIGLGVDPEGRWPNVLVKHLQENNINIKLIANPSVSGYTVQDAIKRELPVIEREKPNFVTILIGANDNFGNDDAKGYQQELSSLIDKTLNVLENKNNLVLINIPDYSKSPAGASYGAGRNISDSVNQYNNVIKEEAKKRNLKVVDLFPLSQGMTSLDLYIDDGLHPSAKGYAMWEKEIYPVVYKLLNE